MDEQLPDSGLEDNEPLVINRPEHDGARLKFRQRLNIIAVNIIVLGYFIPLYAFSVTLELDVNTRIASSYNTSDRNRDACLQGNVTNETKIHNHIEAEASHWMILISVSALVPTFFVSLIVGPISDKIGRKVAFLIPTLGTFVKYIGSLLISYFQWPIWSYSIIAFVEGLSGSASLFYAACVAYTADNTGDNLQRSFWIVVVDLTLSFSAVIGNFSIGYLITRLGYTWCYIILGIIQLCTLLLIMAFIGGTTLIVATGVKIFTTEHFKRTRNLFTRDNNTKRRWKLNTLLLIYCLAILGNTRLSDVPTYTMLDTPLCFSSIMVGNFFSCLHVVMTFGGFLLLLLRKCGIREIPLLYVAYISLIGFEIMVSLAQDEKTIFACKYTPTRILSHR